MTTETYDVAIIGGGPGGAVLGAYLTSVGRSVAILERETFPRYHIGESLTGMGGEVLNELGLGDKMDEMLFPPKGGVKVIGHSAQSEFFVPVLWPTWQVRRDEFDTILLNHAITQGAVHLTGNVRDIIRDGNRVIGLTYVPSETPSSAPRSISCSIVADASGQHTLLSRLGIAGERRDTEDFCRQIALFTQFRHARRDPGAMGNNTFIFYSKIHHWAWFIPISPDVVSVGVVMPNDIAQSAGESLEAAFDWGIQHINPNLRDRVVGCESIEPIRAIRNYSYTVEPFVGNGWLCVGDAHRFIDPIFSFGVSFAMLEARAAANAIQHYLTTGDESAFQDYEQYCNRGQSGAFDLIRYFWKHPIFFGYNIRGRYRKDIIQMLGSDMHSPSLPPALSFMRSALYQ